MNSLRGTFGATGFVPFFEKVAQAGIGNWVWSKEARIIAALRGW